MFILFVAVAILFALALLDTPERNRLSEDEFIEIYTHLAITQVQYGNNPGLWQQETKRLYTSYNTSPVQLEQFRQSLTKKPERWEMIWNKIVHRLEALQKISDSADHPGWSAVKALTR